MSDVRQSESGMSLQQADSKTFQVFMARLRLIDWPTKVECAPSNAKARF